MNSSRTEQKTSLFIQLILWTLEYVESRRLFFLYISVKGFRRKECVLCDGEIWKYILLFRVIYPVIYEKNTFNVNRNTKKNKCRHNGIFCMIVCNLWWVCFYRSCFSCAAVLSLLGWEGWWSRDTFNELLSRI